MMLPLPSVVSCVLLLVLAGCGPVEEGSVVQGETHAAQAALPAASVAAPSLPVEPQSAGLAPAAHAPGGIVLITLDTLRRDHLGCYGYFRETSPRMDAFAAQSLVFERALATAASTFPSHLSMLTGLYPHQHGRTSNQEGVREPFVSGPGCASLARQLRDSGWQTAAFVSSRVMAEDTGINDGFETYWCPGPRGNPARSATTADRALEWLETVEPGVPFFLWVHLWDTHEPNDPPEPFASMFGGDERVGTRIAAQGIDVELLRQKFAADAGIAKQFFGDSRVEREKSMAERYEEKLERKKRRRASQEAEVSIDQAALVDLWDRYDACVRYVDDQVGRVLDGLAQKGLADRALVAIVADHGQSLGENVSLGHGRITNVNTFVPWMLRIPGEAARRDSRLVSLVDLAPTLLGRFGPDFLAGFRAQFEGQDVLAADFARPYVLVEEASGFHGTSGPVSDNPARCALLEGRWKYLFSVDGNELYDLEGEGEGVDVLPANWDQSVRLHAQVEELLKRRPEVQSGAPVADDKVKELLEDLEKMGYVEGE